MPVTERSSDSPQVYGDYSQALPKFLRAISKRNAQMHPQVDPLSDGKLSLATGILVVLVS